MARALTVTRGGPSRTFPKTLTVETQSGGLHDYYVASGPAVSTAGVIAPGVDTRVDGGYVIAPGSPGYRVSLDHDLAAWPQWLTDRMAQGRRAKVTQGHGRRVRRGPQVELGDQITAGSRNSGLASIAGQFLHYGVPSSDLEDALLVYNTHHIVPELEEDEVRRVAASILRTRERGGSSSLSLPMNQGSEGHPPRSVARRGRRGRPAVSGNTMGLSRAGRRA